MSQENVEIAKAVFDAVNRNDWDAFFKEVAATTKHRPNGDCDDR